MKNYIQKNEWKIIEKGFHPEYNRITESLCTLGNGQMGHRGMFEETYSGDSLQGHYVAGVYYPDKTRVGWWKNGYPEYFAKILNAPNWIGIKIMIDDKELDLKYWEIIDFKRILNMKKGCLIRKMHLKWREKEIKITSKRFCSMAKTQVGAIRYAITPINFSGKIEIIPFLDGDVINEDTNWEEKFWTAINSTQNDNMGLLTLATKKTNFHVTTAMKFRVMMENETLKPTIKKIVKPKYVGASMTCTVAKQQKLTIEKICGIVSTRNYSLDTMESECEKCVQDAYNQGFAALYKEHKQKWKELWTYSDIEILGNKEAQQGIRFNIFHLNQTYQGEDERLNIGPKGFSGEKYGGSTYWDTEAYCLPFYLATSPPKVARQLLVYRYHHLQKAIENAEKLGFSEGAALYPMVTITGEECHNEWEITFEEIHRNGAIAYAIYDYIQHTGDTQYLAEMGLEVLIGIARFWSQRVNFSEDKNQYVLLGVTGPNEYENNVNNNWYTNYLAKWCLEYTQNCVSEMSKNFPHEYDKIAKKTAFNQEKEIALWEKIAQNLYFPKDKKLNIFLQQDGFLDKEIKPTSQLPEKEKPIHQHWSWDRILRSCYIKQADVLQGMYFFEDDFSSEALESNFNFYEPLTVHESSLSPCIHAILATRLKKYTKAYEMYLRTARLDIDDYNNDTKDGLHITSMAGTWMAIVKGFGGMRIKNEELYLNPTLPKQWKQFTFNIIFKEQSIQVKVTKEKTIINRIRAKDTQPLSVYLHNKKIFI